MYGKAIRLIGPYLFGGLIVFLALQVKWLIQPFISTSPPFLTFFAAIMVTAWHWGFRPALFAMVLSAVVIDYYLVVPLQGFAVSPADLGTLGLFGLVGTVLAYSIDHLQSARCEAVTTQKQLQRLHELSTELLNEEHLEHMLQRVLKAALELLRADKGVIQLYDSKDHALAMIAQVGFNQEFANQFHRLSIDVSSCGAAFQRKERVLIENVATDPVFSRLAPLFSIYEVVSAQTTPLFTADRRVFGLLSTYYSKPHVPSEEEFRLVDLYARQAERVLEAKHHEEGLRRAKVELEGRVAAHQQELRETEERLRGLISELAGTEERARRHLASELHDYLGQLLALGLIKLKLARQFLGRSPGQSERYIQDTAEALNLSLEYARTLIAKLCPSELHDSGLPAAVGVLAGQMSRHGLAVELCMSSDSLALPDDEAVLLYKSVRELLMNVVKHAGVDRATVTLTVDSDNTILVRVQDAGRGFDVSSVKPNGADDHFGLASIREQMAAMGGWLHEESAIGRGTTTTLGLPLLPLGVVRSERAASSLRQDRVRAKTLEPPAQESLPLG